MPASDGFGELLIHTAHLLRLVSPQYVDGTPVYPGGEDGFEEIASFPARLDVNSGLAPLAVVSDQRRHERTGVLFSYAQDIRHSDRIRVDGIAGTWEVISPMPLYDESALHHMETSLSLVEGH